MVICKAAEGLCFRKWQRRVELAAVGKWSLNLSKDSIRLQKAVSVSKHERQSEVFMTFSRLGWCFCIRLWFFVSLSLLIAFWCYLYALCVLCVLFPNTFNIFAWFTYQQKKKKGKKSPPNFTVKEEEEMRKHSLAEENANKW